MSTWCRIVYWMSRLAVGGVFAWAAVPKLIDADKFAQDIANYHLLPERLVPFLAAYLPPLELLCALALLFGFWVRGASFLVGMMLLGFTVGLVQAIVRGIQIDCGCFGSAAESEISWLSVIRNVSLLVCTVVVFCYHARAARLHAQHAPNSEGE